MKNHTPRCSCRRRWRAEAKVGRGPSPPRKSLCPAHRRRHIGTTTTTRPPPHISHPGRSSAAADTHIVHVVARAHTHTVSSPRRRRRLVVSWSRRLYVSSSSSSHIASVTRFLPPSPKNYTPPRDSCLPRACYVPAWC